MKSLLKEIKEPVTFQQELGGPKKHRYLGHSRNDCTRIWLETGKHRKDTTERETIYELSGREQQCVVGAGASSHPWVFAIVYSRRNTVFVLLVPTRVRGKE